MEENLINFKAGFDSEGKTLLIKIHAQSKLSDNDIIRSLSKYVSQGIEIPNGKSNWTQEFAIQPIS